MPQSQVEADSAAGETYEFDDVAGNARLDGNDLEQMVRSADKGRGDKANGRKEPADEADLGDDNFNPYDTLRQDRNTDPDADADELAAALRSTENNPELDVEAAPEAEAEKKPATAGGWEEKFDLSAELEGHGLGHLKEKYANPKEAVRGLVEAARLVGQRSEDASKWQRLAEDEGYQREVMDYLVGKFGAPPAAQPSGAHGTQPAASAAPVSEEAPKGAPVFDPAWYPYLDGGKLRPDTPSDVRDGISRWRAEKRKYDENPNAYLEPLIQYRIKKGIEEAVKPLTEAQKKAEEDRRKEEAGRAEMERTFSRGQDALSKYSKYTLAYDDQGRPLTDGQGRQMLTQAGDAFNGFLRQALDRSRQTRTLEGFDISDPEGRVEWAWKQTLAHFQKSPAKSNGRPGPGADKRLDRQPGGTTRGAVNPRDAERAVEGVTLDADGLEAALMRAVRKGP